MRIYFLGKLLRQANPDDALQRRILELLADLEPSLALLAEKLCALLGRAEPRDLDNFGRLLDELREDLIERLTAEQPPAQGAS